MFDCNTCPGVERPQLELLACKCKADLWWDGENCVSRTQCPCMVGHLSYVTKKFKKSKINQTLLTRYAVGSVFEQEDCSQCICKLGGVSHCTPKRCNQCPQVHF